MCRILEGEQAEVTGGAGLVGGCRAGGLRWGRGGIGQTVVVGYI